MSKDLKERMKKKRAELASSGNKGGNVLYVEEGTTRVRILPTKTGDFYYEATHVFLNKDLKGVFSAETFGEPCPVVEAYNELKNSKDDDDQDLAKKLMPRKTYLIPVVVYDDEKGKKIDKEKSTENGRLMKISAGVLQNILDLYLDEDEWGDMSDPKEGFDIKIIRTGKGMNDTEYTVAPCKNTPLDKAYSKKLFDLDGAVKALVEPYDKVKDKVNTFLGLDFEDDKKKSKKKKKSGDDFKSKKDKSNKDKTKDKDAKSKGDKKSKTPIKSKLKKGKK